MSPDHAQLSSIATGLDELVQRVADAAEAERTGGRNDLAADLCEVERSLRAASRRLAPLVRRLG